MNPRNDPPEDTLQIRCPKLGHQIHFSYCRTENFGVPCPRAILCWHPYFAVEAYLRQELTPKQWDSFNKPVQPKVTTLVEMIEQARKSSMTGGKKKA